MDRETAMRKAQKLMGMATDGRGNEHEAETALRQAESLMRKFGLEQSEVVASKASVTFDWGTDFAPYSWTDYRVTSVPLWFQWIATAVGTFTDTIVKLHSKADLGLGIGFYGESSDVAFAVWLQLYLRDTVRKTVERQTDLGRSEKADFRKAMVLRLCSRMKTLRRERDAEFKAAVNSRGEVGTALVIINDKLAKRDAEFGAQTYGKAKKVELRSAAASARGHEAGNKVGFNRPVGNSNNDRRIAA